MEYKNFLDESEKKKDEIDTLFKKLKRKKPKVVDQLFHSEHENAFEEIDCLQCANCCKTTSPIFRDVDVRRISKRLKISEKEFESDYLRKDEDGDWVLKSSPCFFLVDDNTCGIYEYRPQACREYPHTDRKRMHQILNLTKRNVEVCPAVSRMVLNILKNT